MEAQVFLAPLVSSLFGHAVAIAVVLVALSYSWHLCLMLLLAWCIVTLGVAANLGSRHMPKLCNASWMLANGQLFALGSLISINAGRSSLEMGEELQRLQAASNTQHVKEYSTDLFPSILLFGSNDELTMANLSSLDVPVKVSPSLTSAHSFSDFQNRVIFAAWQGKKQQLRYFDSQNCCSEAVLLHEFESGMEVETILVASDLLVRGISPRCGLGQRALFVSDGNQTWEAIPCGGAGPSATSLLIELFVAALPTTLLSAFLWYRQPGMFVSLFLGIYSMILIIRVLINSNLLDAYSFIAPSMLVYCSLALISLLCWHFLRPSHDQSFRDQKQWTFAAVFLSFTAALHLQLDLPNNELWSWIVFAAAGLLQMLFGEIVNQRWPKIVAGKVL